MVQIDLERAWQFALTVDLERVFGWRMQFYAVDPAGNSVHLLQAHDPDGRRVTGLGLYDRRRLAAILATLPPRAYLRGDPFADVQAARKSGCLSRCD